jgi:hypothetical protein
MRTTHDVLSRLRAEFLEMPGLRLTPEQVQRLCGIEHTLCQAVLDSLVAAEFLCVTLNGTYGRVTNGTTFSSGAAKADLGADRLSAQAS